MMARVVLSVLVAAGVLVAAKDSFHTTLPRGSRSCGGVTEGNEHVAVATYVSRAHWNHTGYENFVRSLEQHGWGRAVNLGTEDHEWKETSHVRHWAARATAYKRYVAGLPEDRVVLLVDGMDVLITGGPRDMAQKYHGFKRGIVFAAERLCDTLVCHDNPETVSLQQSLAPASSTHKYLNAGMVIGKAGLLRDFLSDAIDIMAAENVDDQSAAVQLMSAGHHDVTLDYDSAVFGVISPAAEHFEEDWESTDKTPLQRSSTKQIPIALHFAGMHYNSAHRFTPCQKFQIEQYNGILASLPTRTDRPRIVVSLTTTPQRVFHLHPTLDSLLAQIMRPDVIYLNLPYYSRRFKKEYEVPDYLHDYSKVVVNRCEDYGPATKLIPVLDKETDPDTLIITVDDEYRYPPQMIQDLVHQHQQAPHAAYGYAGQNIERDSDKPLGLAVRSADIAEYHAGPSAVDILEAFLGAVYRRSFFNADELKDIAKECWTTDDIWFAAHLASRNVPRIKLPMPFARPTETENDQISPLRENNVNGLAKNVVCSSKLLAVFEKTWPSDLEMCSVRYTALGGLADEPIGGVAPWWRPTMLTSPCNLADASKGFFEARRSQRQFRVLANSTCLDGLQNGDEVGVDCGGSCGPCPTPQPQLPPPVPTPTPAGMKLIRSVVRIIRVVIRALRLNILNILARRNNFLERVRSILGITPTPLCIKICRVDPFTRVKKACYNGNGDRIVAVERHMEVLQYTDSEWELFVQTETMETSDTVVLKLEQASDSIAGEFSSIDPSAAYVKGATTTETAIIEEVVPASSPGRAVPVPGIVVSTPNPVTIREGGDDNDDGLSGMEIAVIIICCVLALCCLVAGALYLRKKKESKKDKDIAKYADYPSPSPRKWTSFSQQPDTLKDVPPLPIQEFQVGEPILGQYIDGAWYPGSIRSKENDGTYSVNWDDGTYSSKVPAEQIQRSSAGSKHVDVAPPAVGDEVEALYEGMYYPATIAAIDKANQTCTLDWDDGTHSLSVPLHHVRRKGGESYGSYGYYYSSAGTGYDSYTYPTASYAPTSYGTTRQ